MDTFEKNYWLGILPHVFYSKAGEKILLYNTKNGTFIRSHQPEVISLMDEIHLKKNLGYILLQNEASKKEAIAQFIEESTKKNICKLIPISDEKAVKPIQMMPIVNLQRDVDKLLHEKERFIGENLIHYMLNLNIQLCSNCSLNCSFCDSHYKQFPFCTKKPEGILTIEQLEKIFLQVKNAPHNRTIFSGGNILEYKHLEKLIGLIKRHKLIVAFGIHYSNCNEKVSLLADFEKEIYINFPLSNINDSVIRSLAADRKNKFSFSVSSEEEYAETEYFANSYQINNYSVRPFYNGKNADFFQENVFLNEEDILSNTIKQRQIFANQKMNTNFFGSIYVRSDGSIYANQNNKKMGSIDETSILDVVCKELVENTSWRKIRNAKPCVDCIYQFLCPSTSNYELVFDRCNLCTYKKQ